MRPARVTAASVALVVAAACGGSDGGPVGGPGNLPCGVAVSGVPTISVSLPQGTEPVDLEAVATGLGFLTSLTSPRDDTRRFVVTEKDGLAWMFLDGTRLTEPFLDLSEEVSTNGERGLFALAFHPDFTSGTRYVFVSYTDPAGDSRVVRYEVPPASESVDATTATVVLAVGQPASNHNGGQIAFGPDGRLYVALGDGGGGNDQFCTAQDPGNLLGKLLRIDVDGAGGPAGTPEVWALGLRNPWRFSFDRETDDLYVADVGQGAREEVNVVAGDAAGVNYGWVAMEGSFCRLAAGCGGLGYTLPVVEYTTHGPGGGCAVTGGFVYRGSAILALKGHYFYSDFCSRWVRSFRYENGAVTQHVEWPALLQGSGVASFGEDASGELYVLTDGTIYKIVPAGP